MRRDPVELSRTLQLAALLGIVTTLLNDATEVLAVSLDDHHLHVLARFRDREPRNRMGWAKMQATKAVKLYIETERVKQTGADLESLSDLAVGEGIWAKRGKEKPIADRQHQLRVIEYIADHATRGAVTFLHPNADRWLREKRKNTYLKK